MGVMTDLLREVITEANEAEGLNQPGEDIQAVSRLARAIDAAEAELAARRFDQDDQRSTMDLLARPPLLPASSLSGAVALLRARDDERREMLALLREIEYVDTSGGEYQSQCPACGAHGPDWRNWVRKEKLKLAEPHRVDCRLAAFIGAKP